MENLTAIQPEHCIEPDEPLSPEFDPCFTSTDWNEFQSIVEKYALESGFAVFRTVTYFDFSRRGRVKLAEDPTAVPQFGAWLCSGATGSGEKCKFKVRFGFLARTNEYRVTSFDLEHLCQPDIRKTIDPRFTYVNMRKMLTSEERECIRQLAMLDPKLRKVKSGMMKQFPFRIYSSKLVSRELKLAQTNMFKTVDPLEELVKIGEEVKVNGGQFKMLHAAGEQGPRVGAIIFQTKLQRDLAELYSDVIQVDSTFNVGCYAFQLCLPLGIDCLNRSLVFGFEMFSSESSAYLVPAFELFGLKKEGATLLSDGAKAFKLLAEKLELNQVRCQVHYLESMIKAASGLRDEDAQRFQRLCSSVIK